MLKNINKDKKRTSPRMKQTCDKCEFESFTFVVPAEGSKKIYLELNCDCGGVFSYQNADSSNAGMKKFRKYFQDYEIFHA